MSKYEVQTCCICGGWQNIWHVIEPDGKERPETFESEQEAIAALAEFLEDIENEMSDGLREVDEGFALDEFRIVKIIPYPKGV
jgi:hypothetical protein